MALAIAVQGNGFLSNVFLMVLAGNTWHTGVKMEGREAPGNQAYLGRPQLGSLLQNAISPSSQLSHCDKHLYKTAPQTRQLLNEDKLLMGKQSRYARR